MSRRSDEEIVRDVRQSARLRAFMDGISAGVKELSEARLALRTDRPAPPSDGVSFSHVDGRRYVDAQDVEDAIRKAVDRRTRHITETLTATVHAVRYDVGTAVEDALPRRREIRHVVIGGEPVDLAPGERRCTDPDSGQGIIFHKASTVAGDLCQICLTTLRARP